MKAKMAVSIVLTIVILGSPLLVYAQNFQYVLGMDYYAPLDVPMPQKGVTFTDPDFHTTIVRVTDKSEYVDTGIENEYSKTDPENCDGSIVILRGNEGNWYLYDTKSFEMKKLFGGWFVDGIEPEPRWSPTDPKVLYYIFETELRTYNLDTDTSAVVHNFKSDFPSASYITTGTEGNPSLDQRYWSFLVEDSDFNLISAVVYDKQTNTIVGHREDFPDKVEDVSMDLSGSHCMFGFDYHVFQVCSRDFSSIKDLPAGANGHNDFALTADGRDVLVYQNTQTDYISMTDLDTGIETQLLVIPFNINTDIGLHISGNCADQPGWVLVSTYGSKQPPDESHSWMDTQLFILQLQPNPIVWRVAHTQAYTANEYTGEKNYFAESFATINKAGSRVYFGSNWNDFTPDYTDVYQVMLPAGWSAIVQQSTSPTSPASPTSPTLTPSPTPTEEEELSQSLPLEYILLPVLAAVIAVAVLVVVLLIRRNRRAGKDQ